MKTPTGVRASPVHRLLVPLLMAASLVPIWSAEYFPSQNGPWHLLTIQMLHEYNNPAFNYAEFYKPSLHAIPHLAHTLLVYLLAFVFPLLVAHKIAISLYALLLPASVFWFLATVNGPNLVFGYVSFLLIYNVPLFRGYHDFVLGIPLVLITLTCWLRHRHHMSTSRTAMAMLLIVCVYLSHLFNFLTLGLAMLVYSLYEPQRLRALTHLSLLFIPASLLLAEFAWFSVHETQWMDASDLRWLAPHAAVEGFFRNFLHGLSTAAYVIAVVPLVAGGLWVLRSLKASYDRSGRTVSGVVFANPQVTLLLILTGLYFVTPHKLFGWHYVNVRFVPFVIVFAAAILITPTALTRRAAVATLTMASLALFSLVTLRIREADGLIRQYLSATSKVRPNAVILPVTIESTDVGEISVLARAYEYYPMFRGGANGKGVAQFNTVTPMVYRTYPTKDRFPTWHPEVSGDLRPITATYDYVLLWGWDPYPAIPLRRASFEPIHQEGNIRLFENQRRKPVETDHRE